MDLNRKRAVACAAACAVISSAALASEHHISNAWSFIGGFAIGLTIVLAIAYFIKSHRMA